MPQLIAGSSDLHAIRTIRAVIMAHLLLSRHITSHEPLTMDMMQWRLRSGVVFIQFCHGYPAPSVLHSMLFSTGVLVGLVWHRKILHAEVSVPNFLLRNFQAVLSTLFARLFAASKATNSIDAVDQCAAATSTELVTPTELTDEAVPSLTPMNTGVRAEPLPTIIHESDAVVELELDDLGKLEDFLYSVPIAVDDAHRSQPKQRSHMDRADGARDDSAHASHKSDRNTEGDTVEENVALLMDKTVPELLSMARRIAEGAITSEWRDRVKSGSCGLATNAFASGSLAVVTWLVQNGFQVLAIDGDMENVLRLGLDHDDQYLIDTALRAGADVNRRVIGFGTLLQRAIIRQSLKQVETLLDLDALIHKTESVHDMGGNCALMAAVSVGDGTLTSMLLRLGADAAEVCGIFGSALHTAAYTGRFAVVQALLDFSPSMDVNARDDRGLTALNVALEGIWFWDRPR